MLWLYGYGGENKALPGVPRALTIEKPLSSDYRVPGGLMQVNWRTIGLVRAFAAGLSTET